jgi:hypothetical protein
VFGAVTSGGAAAGLLAGGVLTEYLRWRWCLHVNVIIAVGAALTGRAVLPDPAHRSPGRIPVADAILITAGLAAVVLDCSRTAPYGWGSARVVVPLACGALAVAAFLIIQAGRPEPLLPQQLLAWTDRTGAYVAVATAVVGSYGLFLMLSYHFQTVLGYSPARAGLAFLPMTAAVAGGGYAIVRILPYVRPQTLMATGLLLASAGLVLLSALGPGSGYLGLILPAELLVGAGMAGMFTPTINSLTGDADPLEADAAVANTALQVGGSVGVAVLGTIAVTAAHDSLAAHAGPAEALVRDFGTAAGWAALLPACAAAVVLVTVRAARPAARPHL